jgi:hypothetical protein
VIRLVSVFRDHGVLICLLQHINKIASACFYHLRRLQQLWFILDQAAMQRLVSASIFSRLDYCSSALSSLPSRTIAPVQRVMNAAARLIAKLGTHDHTTETRRQLHWLPVAWRVVYKYCLLQQVAAHSRLRTSTRRSPRLLLEDICAPPPPFTIRCQGSALS